MHAELILYRGNFITLDEKQPNASALTVTQEKISGIGDYEDVKDSVGPDTVQIDLQGKTVVPGFIDAHIHLITLGLATQVMDLRGIVCKSDLLVTIEKKVKDTPARHWVRGFGFNKEKLDALPTRFEIDPISQRNPVYLEDINSNLCVVNSLALERVVRRSTTDVRRNLLRTETGIVQMDRYDIRYDFAGVPNIDPVGEDIEETELERAIEAACQSALRVGITSIHDLQLPPKAIRVYRRLAGEGKIPLRVYLGCDRNQNISLQDYLDEGLGTEPYPNKLKIGLVKLFADGRIPETEFEKRVLEAHQRGFQLAIHASDLRQYQSDRREVELTIEAIGEALRTFPRKDHRHRIEHATYLNENLIEKMKSLKIIVSTQPELMAKYDENLPDDALIFPIRSMIVNEIIIAGGSDAPTYWGSRRAAIPRNLPNPLAGIAFEVSRELPNGLPVQTNQRISILRALRIHTINGAYTSFDEQQKGTLEIGKLADMAVLSEDILEADPEEIGSIRVEMTIIGGKIVYAKGRERTKSESLYPDTRKR